MQLTIVNIAIGILHHPTTMLLISTPLTCNQPNLLYFTLTEAHFKISLYHCISHQNKGLRKYHCRASCHSPTLLQTATNYHFWCNERGLVPIIISYHRICSLFHRKACPDHVSCQTETHLLK